MNKSENILIELQCLPNIDYWKMLVQAKLTIEGWENYNKKSYRNKFKILTSNGAKIISIPLKKGKNDKTPYKKVKIAYDEDWIGHLEKTLFTNYKNAPYFDHYISELMAIFEQNEKYIFELNLKLIDFIIKQLSLDVQIKFSESYEKTSKHTIDLREKMRPNKIYPSYGTLEDYGQVFEYKFGFTPQLSILDMLFNVGPGSILLLS